MSASTAQLRDKLARIGQVKRATLAEGTAAGSEVETWVRVRRRLAGHR